VAMSAAAGAAPSATAPAGAGTGLSLVFVTVPSKDVGQNIARSLVENKLAACVNIIPGGPLGSLRQAGCRLGMCVCQPSRARLPAHCRPPARLGAQTIQLPSLLLAPHLLLPPLMPLPLLLPLLLQGWSLCISGRARCSQMRSCC
jgi:hypothetical protein